MHTEPRTTQTPLLFRKGTLHDDSIPAVLPATVRKRDGAEVAFNPGRIETALLKAGHATGEFDDNETRLLTAQVLKVLSHSYDVQPTIERIQNIVEQVLISANHLKTARSN